MLFSHRLLYPFLLVFISTLLGCSSKSITYKGITYPPTNNVQFTFQEQAIPEECRVFSHAIVTTPENINNLEIKNRVAEDAKGKGADLVFVGLAKAISKGDAPDTFEFHPYGPEEAYLFRQQWVEWEFGFKQWGKGEDLVNLGYDNYTNPDFTSETGFMVKHILLTCKPSS